MLILPPSKKVTLYTNTAAKIIKLKDYGNTNKERAFRK